jgi:hypothetical protein
LFRLFAAIVVVFGWALPAHAADISIVGALFREATLEPGGHTQGMVIVRNNTDAELPVRAYVVDYAYDAGGSDTYAAPGSLPRSDAAWITLQPDRATIPAGASARLYYTVAVPSDRPLAGTYWSMMIVEPDPDRPRAAGVTPGIAVNTVIRYGMQIAVHVGAGQTEALTFGAHDVGHDGARAVVSLDVRNDGDDLANPLVWIEAFTPEGISVGRFEARRARLYPGCSARFRIDVGDLPPGTYSALAVADAGGAQVYGSQFPLVLE